MVMRRRIPQKRVSPPPAFLPALARGLTPENNHSTACAKDPGPPARFTPPGDGCFAQRAGGGIDPP